MKPEIIIRSYYDSLNKKDDRWQQMWAEDAEFSDSSQTIVARGKSEIIASFTTFLPGMENVSVQKLIVSGGDVCAVVTYSYVNRKGGKMTQTDAEVWEIKGGTLHTMTLFFDITAYRSFMKS